MVNFVVWLLIGLLFGISHGVLLNSDSKVHSILTGMGLSLAGGFMLTPAFDPHFYPNPNELSLIGTLISATFTIGGLVLTTILTSETNR